MNNSIKVQMTDELYKNIEAGQAGLLNIINNFFEKIGTEPNLGGSINEMYYFEADKASLDNILETEIVPEAKRTHEDDYGHDYKRYIAIDSKAQKVQFINSFAFGSEDIPKFVGDSIFQKQMLPDFLVVEIDRQYYDSEEYPRYDYEIHKVNQKHLEEYFEKKLAEAAKELKSYSLNLNWFTRSLIEAGQAGRYNVLRNLNGTSTYCIDEASVKKVNYFKLQEILSCVIDDDTNYYFASSTSDRAYKLGGKNIGARIFSEKLINLGDCIVIATPTGNLDRNGCWGQKYSVTIYLVNKNHLVDMYNRKTEAADKLPDVTLSDIVKSAKSTRRFLKNNPNIFIRTGQFVSYPNQSSPFFEYINSNNETVLNNDNNKSLIYPACETEGRYDKNENFERAFKNVIGNRYAHQGYIHEAVVWALYNPEKVPEGWVLPKVVR